MKKFPKIGTPESLALAKLIENPGGITHLSFPEDSELHNPQRLAEVINNLMIGSFEAEDISKIKLDS